VIGGPGSLATRGVTRAVIPALGSEGAGKLAEGTAAEPYAKVAGAIAGSILGHKIASPATLANARPTTEQVIQAGSQGYKEPAIAAVSFKPNVVESLSNTISSTLDRAKLNDRLAPQTRSIVEEMKTPIGQAHTIEDLETARQLLGKVAGNFTNPVEQGAASKAIELVDKYMARMPQTHLATGDAAAANEALTTARANYAAGKTAERVGEKLNNAELQAASAHSGGNIDNATRQKLRPLLTSDKQGRGLTDAELGLIENSVRGSTLGNALRVAGKFLGGGGGLALSPQAARVTWRLDRPGWRYQCLATASRKQAMLSRTAAPTRSFRRLLIDHQRPRVGLPRRPGLARPIHSKGRSARHRSARSSHLNQRRSHCASPLRQTRPA
jgi:hypothetical protein